LQRRACSQTNRERLRCWHGAGQGPYASLAKTPTPPIGGKGSQKGRAIEHKAYKPLFTIIFAVSLGFSILDPFFPVYLNTIGATGTHLAFIVASFSLSKLIFTPLFGWLSDRRGRKGLIVGGLVIYTAVSVSYLVATSVPSLILIRFVQGIGAALVRPIALAFVGETAPEDQEGITMGTFDISFYGALAVGPVLGGVMQEAFGYPALFVALLVLSLFSLAVAVRFVPDVRNGISGHGEPLHQWAPIGGSPVFLSLLSFIFTRAFGIVLVAVFLPLAMSLNLKLDSLHIGIVMAAGTVVTAVLLRPMGRLSDLRERRIMVLGGGVAASLLSFCIPFVSAFWQLLVLAILIGGFNVLSMPASAALLVMEGNKHGMGLTMGVFNGFMNLGFVIGPVAGGLLMDLWGLPSVFLAAGAVGILGLIPLAFTLRGAST
jgi:MFS family permease